ncbi:MAG: shikimate dehydrogenase [Acidimicrobiales bacterium]|jgi:shikimate dehydrogenase
MSSSHLSRRAERASRADSWPSAASTVVGVIGDPVEHSLSPLIHNAAFDAMGLDWVSVAFRVVAGGVPEAFSGMRALGIAGLSVTTPHKDAAAASVDELSELARRLGAVNCVTRRDGLLFGDSTDGEGFVQALRRGCGFDPSGARCVVVGAGGAARAVVVALAEAGATEVAVVNRTPTRALQAATLAGDAGRVGSPSDVPGADLVVQATSLGMAGLPSGQGSGEESETSGAVRRLRDAPEGGCVAMPVDPDLLRDGQLVAELVVNPLVTPFMEAAEAHGARTFGGLGMLVHQAALAIERWTGEPAPVEAMWRAVTGRSESVFGD